GYYLRESRLTESPLRVYPKGSSCPLSSTIGSTDGLVLMTYPEPGGLLTCQVYKPYHWLPIDNGTATNPALQTAAATLHHAFGRRASRPCRLHQEHQFKWRAVHCRARTRYRRPYRIRHYPQPRRTAIHQPSLHR